MQAADPEVALGGDGQRAADRQVTAGPPAFERAEVEGLDAPCGVVVDRAGARLFEEMRQVGRDRDDRLRSAPDQPQRRGDLVRRRVADQDRQDFKRGRHHRLQHHQMHLERMLADERPRVGRRRPRLDKPDMEVAGDPGLAERRAPGRGRMDRQALGRRRDGPARR